MAENTALQTAPEEPDSNTKAGAKAITNTGANTGAIAGRLRRDLGVIEAYAALVGILIGAGIFTSVCGMAGSAGKFSFAIPTSLYFFLSLTISTQ